MTTTKVRSLTMLLLFAALGACVGSPPGSQSGALDPTAPDASVAPDGSRPPLTLEAYVAEGNVQGCRYLFECCRLDERQITATDRAACEVELGGGSDRYLEMVRASIEAGRVRFDSEAAARALALADAVSCTDIASHYGTLPDGWASPIIALGDDGDPCVSLIDCVSSFCGADGSGVLRCAQPPALGEPCDGVCGADGSCDAETRTCIALVGEGSACRWSGECERPLYCVGSDGFSATGTCVPYDRCLGT